MSAGQAYSSQAERLPLRNLEVTTGRAAVIQKHHLAWVYPQYAGPKGLFLCWAQPMLVCVGATPPAQCRCAPRTCGRAYSPGPWKFFFLTRHRWETGWMARIRAPQMRQTHESDRNQRS